MKGFGQNGIFFFMEKCLSATNNVVIHGSVEIF